MENLYLSFSRSIKLKSFYRSFLAILITGLFFNATSVKAQTQFPAGEFFDNFGDFSSYSYTYFTQTSTNINLQYVAPGGVAGNTLCIADMSAYGFRPGKAYYFNYTITGTVPGVAASGTGQYSINYSVWNNPNVKLGDFKAKSMYLAIGASRSANIILRGSRSGVTVVQDTIALTANTNINNTSTTDLAYTNIDAYAGTNITFGTKWAFIDRIDIITPNGTIPVAIDDLTFAAGVPYAPNNQANNLTFSSIAASNANISASINDADMGMIFMTKGNSGTPTITDGTIYTQSTAFGSGSTAGTGWYCVYSGSLSSPVNITGLLPGTTYRTMVVGYNGTAGYQRYNTAVLSGTGTDKNADNFTTALLPKATVSISAIDSASIRPVWAAVNGATAYRYDVATDTAFTHMVPGYNDAAGLSNGALITGLQPSTKYSFRYRIVNASGTSANSVADSVTTRATTPAPAIQPITNINPVNFTLTWAPASGISIYDFDISTDSTFATKTNATISGLLTSITRLNLNAATRYFYRIRASVVTNGFAFYGLYANGSVTTPVHNANLSGLTMAAGNNFAPAFNTDTLNYTITGNNTYFAVTPVKSDPSAIVTINGKVINTNFSSDNIDLLQGGITTPILVSSDGGAVTKTYNIIKTANPILPLAATNVTSNSATIQWPYPTTPWVAVFAKADSTGYPSPVNGTFYTGGNFGTGPQVGDGWYCVFRGSNYNTNISRASFGGLSPLTKYRFVVVGYTGTFNSANTYNPNNETLAAFNFTTNGPPQTAVLTGRSTNSLAVDWDDTPTALGYRVDLATDAAFTNKLYGNIVTNPSNYTFTALAANTTYYFRLVYYSANENPSPYSPTFTFTTSATDPVLTSLSLNNAGLTPVFESGSRFFSPTVNYPTTTLSLAAADGQTVKVNGTVVTGGTVTLPLTLGLNITTATVTAANGIDFGAYTLYINYVKSTDASLSALAINTGTLSPDFIAGITSYSTTVNAPNITITPTTGFVDANITVNGSALVGGAATVPLTVGANVIPIVVTAQDGTTTRTYNLTVNYVQSTDATLSALTINTGTLSPAFSTLTTDYTVKTNTGSLVITPTVNFPQAGIKVNGQDLVAGAATVPLNNGANTISIVVTAQDGTTKTYTITASKVTIPAISYTGPQTYAAGTAIPALTPTSSNVSSLAYAATYKSVATTTSTLAGGTVDPFGNVYLSYSGDTYFYPAGNNTSTDHIVPYLVTYKCASDAAGNIYIIGNNNSSVDKIDVTTHVMTGGFVTGLSGTSAIKVDAAGNIYVGESNNKDVVKITVKNGAVVGTPTVIGTFTNTPQDIAIDGAGNVYVVDGTATVAYKIPATATYPVAQTSMVSVGSGFVSPNMVATDNVGNIYVASGASTDRNFYKITPAGVKSVMIATGLANKATGGIVDASGNLYVCDVANKAEKMIAQTGGYNISPALPAGLSIDQTTGTISGTPTAGSPATNYTITGYYTPDLTTATTTVNIKTTTSVATLAGLNIGTTALDQVFASTTATYTASVINGTINLLATATDAGATIKINNVTVAPGIAIPYTLALGANNYAITVTAGDGIHTQTYNLTVNHVLQLSGLSVNAGALSPAFAPGTSAYSVSVPSGTESITLTPLAADSTFVIKVNGVNVASGTESLSQVLNTGLNNIPVVVTAADGVTTKTYNLAVTRAGVIALSYSGAQSYTVGTAIDPLTPTSTNVAPFASGAAVVDAPGSFFGISSDALGNIYGVTGTTSVYKIPTTGPTAGTPVLVNVGTATPTAIAADAAGNLYMADYSKTTGSAAVVTRVSAAGAITTIGTNVSTAYGVAIDPTGNTLYYVSANTVIKQNLVNGVPSGAAVTVVTISSPAGLAVDRAGNVYIATTGSLLYRLPANGAALELLANNYTQLNAIALDNIGNLYLAERLKGSIYKLNTTTLVTTPVAPEGTFGNIRGLNVDPSGTLYISDPNKFNAYRIAQTGGYYIWPNLPAGLNMDANTGVISGTPLKGLTATTYTVTGYNVAGEKSTTTVSLAVTDASLSNLVTSTGTLAPAFSPATLTYTLPVSATLSTITVTPTAADPTSTITVNGVTTASGTASAAITIAVGTTIIPVVVTAADGLTTKTYNISVIKAALPSISYSGDQTYTAGTPITPFVPTATGVSTYGYGPLTTITTNLATPEAIAVASTGDVYVVNNTPGSVVKVTPAGVISTAAGSYSTGYGIAIDANDNFYVADGNKSPGVTKNGNAITGISGTSSRSYAVAVDLPGNIFYVSTSGGIKKLPVGSTTPVSFGTGATFTDPAIATDSWGNVYAANNSSAGALYKMNPAGVATQVATGLAGPLGIAVDGGNNIYVTDVTHLYTIKAGTSALVNMLPGVTFTSAAGLAIDKLSNIYVVDDRALTTKKMSPAGGYFITPNLPEGLIFDNATGTISGTPTIGRPLTTYTVIGYNNSGDYGSTTFKLQTIGSDATLSNLAINSGTLSPVFAAATTNYTAVTSAATITLTPTAVDNTADIKVSGTTVVSGAASGSVALNYGANTINTVVTAGDGTVKTYVLTVNRILALNSLAASAGTLSPAFANTTTAYTVLTTNSTTTITPTRATGDVTSTINVNGVAVASGSASGSINLALGTNIIPVVVTSGDGLNTITYNVTVIRSGALSALTVSNGTSNLSLSPSFAATTLAYTATSTVPSVTVTPTITDLTNYITVNGVAVTSGTASSGISLTPGDNIITVKVFSNDASTNRIYTVTVTYVPSGTATLSALVVNNGGMTSTVSLSPSFLSTRVAFTATATTPTITIKPTVTDPGSTVTVNGTPVTSGTASQLITLAGTGTTTVTTEVTAGDGTVKDYVITFTYTPSSTATLSAYVISAGTLSPTFNANTLTYTATSSTPSVSIRPTSTDAGATIAINGVSAVSGSALPLTLTAGTNVINTVVTPGNGGATKTYKLTYTYTATATATLSGLTISAGSIGTFASGTLTYTSSVSTATTTVTPTVSDPGATVRINGTIVPSGTASASIPLNVGANAIALVVTPGNGGTTKTYTINVTRALSTNNNLAALKGSIGALTPVFAAATTAYTVNVPGVVTTYVVTPTAADAGATITVNGTTIASGAADTLSLVTALTTIPVVVTSESGVAKTYTLNVTRVLPAIADMSAMDISQGTLSPVFATGTLGYTASVPNGVTSFMLTPTLADALATVKVNGTTVVSGTASAGIPLNAGANNITIVVTAQNGITTKTYTLTITRAASSNASLAALNVSQGALSPAFDTGTNTYTNSVANEIASIMLTPTAADNAATIKVNGTAVASGTASAVLPLVVGDNTISTLVTSQDSTTTQTYTVVVTRLPSANANLANLVIGGAVLDVPFDITGASTELHATAAAGTASYSLTPTTADHTAAIAIDGVPVTSGTALSGVPLSLGENYTTITVTAQDGTVKAYNLVITRTASADTTLAAFTIDNGTLSPVFSSAVKNYTASVSNDVASVVITPVANYAGATVTVNSSAVAAGDSKTISLNEGTNTINTVVTAENGSTATYKLVVTRLLSPDAGLSGILVNAGAFTPGFDTNITSYSMSVANNVSSTQIAVGYHGDNATAKANGIVIPTDAFSADIPLVVGNNPIAIVVTAQNGATKTYTLNITRAGSNNISISNLHLSAGALTNTPGTQNYTAFVAISTGSTSVFVTPGDANATIKVNGIPTASGVASAPVTLSTNSTTFPVVITAEDGVTTRTLLVTVNKTGSNSVSMSDLHLSAGALINTPGTQNYTASVPIGTGSTSVFVTTSDANATIKVNGIPTASGVASAPVTLSTNGTTFPVVITAEDGVTTRTLLITVNKTGSNNVSISEMHLSGGALVNTPGTQNYTVSVPVSTGSTSVFVTPGDANATIKVNGVPAASGVASAPVTLSTNSTTFPVVITAQDGVTTRTLLITVNKIGSNNVSIAEMHLSAGALVNTPGTQNYTVSVPAGTNSTSVFITPSDVNATVKVNGILTAAGVASTPVTLSTNSTTFPVVITAQDGVTTRTLLITVNKIGSNNVSIAEMHLSAGALVNTPGTQNYTVSVSAGTNSTIVFVTPNDVNATVKVNGILTAAGVASTPVTLSTNSTTFPVVITAQDGVTIRTLLITVNKTGSNNVSLSDLHLNAGTLVNTPGTQNYTATVSAGTNSTIVFVTPNDVNATVKVNGILTAAGVASTPVTLSTNSTTFQVVITAQDGVTIRTLLITVNKATNGVSNNFNAGAISLAPVEQDKTVSVQGGLSPNGDGINDNLVIRGINNYPDNKVTIMTRSGVVIYEVRGYDNVSRVFDGHSNKNGQLQLPGTYFYSLEYNQDGQTKHKTGFIIIKY